MIIDLSLRIWVVVEDFAAVDLEEKESFYCISGNIFVLLENTLDPKVRKVIFVDGQRGISLPQDLPNEKVPSFLQRYGVKEDALWWRFPNATLQFKHELDQVREAKRAVGNPSYIYFVLNETRNTLKIGTSKDPEQRLRYLQTSCADPLTYLGAIPGTRQDERQVHEQFAALKKTGEWFEYAGELQKEVEKMLNS